MSEATKKLKEENAKLKLQINESKNKLKSRIDEVTVLYETSNSLAYSHNYREIITIITKALYKVLKYDACSTFIREFVSGGELLTFIAHPINNELINCVQSNILASITPFIGSPIDRSNVHIESQKLYKKTSKMLSKTQMVKSFFNVPLIFKEEFLGMINVFSTKEHAFAQNEITFLYTLANHLASHLGRLKLTLEQEKNKITNMVKSMLDGVIMTDSTKKIATINPAAMALLNLTEHKDFDESLIFNKLEELGISKYYEEAAEKKVPILGKEITTVTYPEKTLSANIAPVIDLEGKLIGVVTVLRDITELKNIDKVKTIRLSVIQDTKDIINSILDLDTLLAVLIEFILTISGSQMGSIMLIDNDKLTTMVHHNFPQKVSDTFSLKDGKTISSYTEEQKKPIYLENFMFNDGVLSQNAKITIDSYLCLPLLVKDKLIGIINIIHKKKKRIPLNKDDIDTLETICGLSATAIENSILYQQTLKQEKINQELKVAHEIQSNLLPKRIPQIENYTFGAISVPARAIGGDYYDIIQLSPKHIGIVVADVVGKGIPAALLMVMVKSIIHTKITSLFSPSQALNILNKTLIEDMSVEKYIPMFYGIINTEENTLTYTNAGHETPIYYESQDNKFLKLDTEGFPVAMDSDSRYEEKCISMGKNDYLVLFTDGIIESINQSGKFFGTNALKKILKDNHHLSTPLLVDKIYKEVLNFSTGAPQHDDLTLVIARNESQNEERNIKKEAFTETFEVDSSKEMVKFIREKIDSISKKMGFNEEAIHNIKLAVNEAHANVIEHAYHGDQTQKIIFQFTGFSDKLVILIKDFGKSASPMFIKAASNLEELEGSGLGVFLMKKYMDKVEYTIIPNEGTELRLTKYLNNSAFIKASASEPIT